MCVKEAKGARSNCHFTASNPNVQFGVMGTLGKKIKRLKKKKVCHIVLSARSFMTCANFIRIAYKRDFQQLTCFR